MSATYIRRGLGVRFDLRTPGVWSALLGSCLGALIDLGTVVLAGTSGVSVVDSVVSGTDATGTSSLDSSTRHLLVHSLQSQQSLRGVLVGYQKLQVLG